ncbi:MAG: prenyltransferase [Candidatus Omnitrophica bacterium]|nr:prenyltransferase [Candidatus Omnitrophota bacterium]
MGRIVSLIRYRFFLWAGLLPYLLGQSLAFHTKGLIIKNYFWLGLLGIFFTLVGVELFNEYFDSQSGGDRVFSLEKKEIPRYFFRLGVFVFMLASFIGIYLSFQVGWPVILFILFGFLGAYFYVGPPIRWAYRGLGETVIALSYGPFMVYGSYYIQTKSINIEPLLPSLICGLFVFCLALLNEIPDYYQDKLIGKRNLVVKMGKQKITGIINICFISIFLFLGLGLVLKKIPLFAVILFSIIPWLWKNLFPLNKNYENKNYFLPVINMSVAVYLITLFILSFSYIK